MQEHHPAQQTILRQIKESPHQKVKVAVSDIDGVLRGKYLDKEKFLSSAHSGFGFCNVVFGWDCADVCYDNTQYTGWHTGYPDAQAVVDVNSFRSIPWENDTPFFLADFRKSASSNDLSSPLEVCPRGLLKTILARGEKQGYHAQVGMEFEWFNFKETPESLALKGGISPQPLTPGMFGYSLLRSSLNQPFFEALLEQLRLFRIPLEGLHTETGPGVLEAAIVYSDALEAADRGILFKTATKEIGYRLGILPTFMAKWNSDLPGCSGHAHQSLWSTDKKTNLFYDEKDPHRMSGLFKSYLAGQLLCLPEILPFFAPTVNSYKRLVDGYWAPTQSNWGIDNRTTAFRVIPGSSKSTRLESRVPGSDVNPYLALAACIGSGLYGIQNHLSLSSPPVSGSAYQDKHQKRLPRNLSEATQRLEESKIAREIFGETFVDHFAKTRAWEWQQFQDSVTHWELKRYLEII